MVFRALAALLLFVLACSEANAQACAPGVPCWTTATRPGSPLAGQNGYNATIASPEWWNGSAWQSITPLNIAYQNTYAPGARAPLFIWQNPTSPPPTGRNAGMQIWIGDNPTATPGGNDTVAATIATINGNSRTNLWGMNILVGQCNTVCGANYLDGGTTGIEIDMYGDAVYLAADRAFNATPTGTPKEALQLVSQGPIQLTAAQMIWATASDGSNWWHEGIAISRVKDIGLHFVINPNGTDSATPYSVASILDESNANVLFGPNAHNNIGLTKAIVINGTGAAGLFVEGNQNNAGVYLSTDGATYSQLITTSASIPLWLGVGNSAKLKISSTVIEMDQTVDFHYAGTTTCTVTGSIGVQINGVAHQIPYC